MSPIGVKPSILFPAGSGARQIQSHQGPILEKRAMSSKNVRQY